MIKTSENLSTSVVFLIIFYGCERSQQYTFTNFNECGQFSRKNAHFQGVLSALEMTFRILALQGVQGPARAL